MLEHFGLPLDMRLLAVAAAVVLGGFMRGFVGFGGALVVVPVLSIMFGPKPAVAIASMIGIPAIFQLLPEAIRYSERPIVVPVSTATFLATPLGSWILVVANPQLMSVVISALVIIMVGLLATGWTSKGEIHIAGLIGAGITGGLIQGAAGIGGPPIVAVALARAGTPKQQRANVLGVMTALALSSLLPLWYFGFFTPQVLAAGLLLTPLYIIATLLGSRHFSSGGHLYFRRAALATLAVIGIGTMIAAVRAYLAG